MIIYELSDSESSNEIEINDRDFQIKSINISVKIMKPNNM